MYCSTFNDNFITSIIKKFVSCKISRPKHLLILKMIDVAGKTICQNNFFYTHGTSSQLQGFRTICQEEQIYK